jgi:hypothetical protein
MVSAHFTGESNELGEVNLGHQNVDKVFVYNAKTYEKLKPIGVDLERGVIVIDKTYCDVEVDY